MNTITAFEIGALFFVFVVALTAYFLKSASFLKSAEKRGVIATPEHVDDTIDNMVDDVNDRDTSVKV